MFASTTIILAGCALPAATQLLEISHYIFLVNIRECTGKRVRCFLQFGHLGCLRTLSTRGNVDTESLAAPSDSNWSVRFQETGDPFAELAHADSDRKRARIRGICVVGQLREVGARRETAR
jgi:hypothetical protein